jgi:hypothetical protein
MLSRLSITLLIACISVLASASAWPQSSPSPRDGLLVLVDHAATSAEAADTCDKRVPGSGAAIRDAHARWQAQHGTAQNNLIELMSKELQARAAARGDRDHDPAQTLGLFRAASLDKLRGSMRAMNEQQLAQFCAGYPGEFDKPAMDFMAQWLQQQSRRR